MKRNRNIIISLLAVIIISCTGNDSGFNFTDQAVKGKILQNDWAYYFGVAHPYLMNPDSLQIQLSDTVFSNPCTYARSERGIYFKVPYKETLTPLHGGFTNPQFVVLYNGNEERFALGGAVEITLIDTLNQVVEGRIDATYDGSNFVNGYFTAHLCGQ